MGKNVGRTIRLPVGRRGFGEVGAHQTVTKKMQESREGQREARELTRALGRLERNAQRQMAEQDLDTMHRDYDIGRMPVPSWAQKYEWHLDVETRQGLCGLGLVNHRLASTLHPRLGQMRDVYVSVDWSHRRREQPKRVDGRTCPQTKYLLWVTCSLCKVALDKGLEEGKFTVGPDSRGKKNRPVVTVVPLKEQKEKKK